jgi:hypothetical protein
MSPELYNAVVAASAVLLGSLIGQFGILLNGRLEREPRRAVILRTKYEELSLLFLMSLKYPMSSIEITDIDEFTECANPKDINQLHMLALIYFPLLRIASGNYFDSYVAFYKTVGGLYDPDDPRKSGEQILNDPLYIESRDAISHRGTFSRKR